MSSDHPATAAGLLADACWKAELVLTDARRDLMARSRTALLAALEHQDVYGVTRGFGPLADFPADPDPLGAAPEPFGAELADVRGHPGHRIAAELIRQAWRAHRPAEPGSGRPFQAPYSLRCAPQVEGAVLDQLWLQESILVTEATGCTDDRAWWIAASTFHATTQVARLRGRRTDDDPWPDLTPDLSGDQPMAGAVAALAAALEGHFSPAGEPVPRDWTR